MEAETKNCQNCQQDFTIEPEDFKFYERIDVPPPTWCPGCRSMRRMASRNIRNLYKRKCDAPGHEETIISIYSPEKKVKVYDQKYWWGDKWDPRDYGKEYDFSRPFFEQLKDLARVAPFPSLPNLNPINSDYVSVTVYSKNCYLVFSSTYNENCSYSEGINECRDTLDVLACSSLERGYECIDCKNSFNLSFAEKCVGCSDSMFLYDCRNCSNCFGCWNLRNQSYCIFNEQFSKEEYFKKLESFKLGSYKELTKLIGIYEGKLKDAITKFADVVNSPMSTGNNIENSRNCRESFDLAGAENSKYVWRILESGSSDNYDVTIGGTPELTYECNGVSIGSGLKFGVATAGSRDSEYIFYCISNSSNLFGCFGMNNQSYCILNKQYTKEEYEKMIPRIKKHMEEMPYIDKNGRVYKYGEFPPPEISPFGYNETLAQEYYPLTKKEALARGFSWKDKEERNYEIDIKNEDIPDNIEDLTEDIVGKVMECAHKGECNEQCTEAFRIIQDEFAFYKKSNIPLPRICPNCRHYQRLKQRTQPKLWRRSCMNEGCTNEFETSYAPDRPEIIYCESCYNQEVY